MSSFPNSPKLIKGGLVVLDAAARIVKRTIALQYNPDSFTRSFQLQGSGEGGGERAQPFRLKGPAIESIKLEADIDATDSLEHPDQNANAVQYGIAPQLAVLERLVNPTTAELQVLKEQSQSGTLEILPPEARPVLSIWSASPLVPVPSSRSPRKPSATLNPMRANVSWGLRVMTTDDLRFDDRGRSTLSTTCARARALAGAVAAQNS